MRNAPCSGAICMPGDRAERRGLVDERELHRVGRRAVPDEVLGELGVRKNDLGATRDRPSRGS